MLGLSHVLPPLPLFSCPLSSELSDGTVVGGDSVTSLVAQVLSSATSLQVPKSQMQEIG